MSRLQMTPTGVDDAFKDLKREHSAAAEVSLLKTLAVQQTNELPKKFFFSVNKRYEKITSHKPILRDWTKEFNI